jgi:hypothetical protein
MRTAVSCETAAHGEIIKIRYRGEDTYTFKGDEKNRPGFFNISLTIRVICSATCAVNTTFWQAKRFVHMRIAYLNLLKSTLS